MAEHSDDVQLNLFGVSEGTDKTWLGHGYLRHYAALFGPFRDRPINFLEIGVAFGGSVRTWEKFFSCAKIIGVDIDPACRKHASDRIAIEIGSQTDRGFLEDVAQRYPPDIIVDDGSHNSDHQIFTLNALFPFLAPGGIYVIEDLGFQVNPASAANFRGEGPVLAMDYFIGIARQRACGIGPDLPSSPQRDVIVHSVERVEFSGGMAVLIKQAAPDPVPMVAALSEAAIEGATTPLCFHYLSDYAMRSPDTLDIAERAAAKAFEQFGDELWYSARLSDIYSRQGRLDEAITAARRSVDLGTERGRPQEYVQRLEALLARVPVTG